jgi:hypothetical protein
MGRGSGGDVVGGGDRVRALAGPACGRPRRLTTPPRGGALAYLDFDLNSPGPAVVALHREQGALVALAAGLLRADAVGSVVCCDTPIAHVRLLPLAVLDVPAAPDLLLAATGVHRESELEEVEKLLASHKITMTTWCWSGEGTQRDLDQAVASRVGRWMDHE